MSFFLSVVITILKHIQSPVSYGRVTDEIKHVKYQLQPKQGVGV